MKIKEKVYTQDTKCKPWFKLSEIKFDIQPDDIIELVYDSEGYYSENESWEPYSQINIYREREEYLWETEKRLEKENLEKEERKQKRYKTYLNLKKEFENE